MIFSNLALGALCFALSIPPTTAGPPRGSRKTTIAPFSSLSFSGITTEAASSTATARASSTDQTDMSHLTRSANTSHSCANVFCLPLSPWTKSEPQPTTPTPASLTTESSSGCSQILSPSRTPSAMSFNFTDSCDSDTDMAEDCRVTLDCDTESGLYPTCEHGKCQCLAKECFRKSMCLDLGQCRDFDDHVCVREGDDGEDVGVCGCKPRVTRCLLEENPHQYCAAGSNCTERHFSLYPEFPYCSTGDSGYPLGRCECRHFDCLRTGDARDYEVCKDLVDCELSLLGPRPYCSLKYGDESKGKEDGYCTCGS